MFTTKLKYAFIASVLLFTSCETNLPTATDSDAASDVPLEATAAAPESERAIIKTAELKLNVDNVSEKIKEVQSAVNAIKGHVTHYEMHANKTFQKKLEYSLDSSYVIHEVNPEGFMKVKIPVAQSDTFIQTMLSMQANIDELLMDEEDITESLHQKKELIETATPVTNETKKLKQEMYHDDKKLNTIQLKAEYAKLNYRTQYLWFDIHLKGNPYIEKNQVASVKNMNEPFYVNAIKALQNGWQGASVFFAAMLNIWPLWIIVAFVLFVFRKKIRIIKL